MIDILVDNQFKTQWSTNSSLLPLSPSFSKQNLGLLRHGDSFIHYLYLILLIVMFNVVSWQLWHIFIESLINFENIFFSKGCSFLTTFFLLKILTFLNAKVTKVLWYVQLLRCKTIEKIFMLDLEGSLYLCFIWEINKLHLFLHLVIDVCLGVS